MKNLWKEMKKRSYKFKLFSSTQFLSVSDKQNYRFSYRILTNEMNQKVSNTPSTLVMNIDCITRKKPPTNKKFFSLGSNNLILYIDNEISLKVPYLSLNCLLRSPHEW